MSRKHRVLHGALSVLCLAFFIGIPAFPDHKVLMGVLFRGALSLIIALNGALALFTGERTYLVRNTNEIWRKRMGIVLLVVGIGALVTVLMGYGINGYPNLWD